MHYTRQFAIVKERRKVTEELKMYISEIRTKAPMDVPRTPLETKMYKMLDKLGIPYEAVRLYLATITSSGFEEWYLQLLCVHLLHTIYPKRYIVHGHLQSFDYFPVK